MMIYITTTGHMFQLCEESRFYYDGDGEQRGRQGNVFSNTCMEHSLMGRTISLFHPNSPPRSMFL